MLDRPIPILPPNRPASLAASLDALQKRFRRPVTGRYDAEIDGLRFLAIAIVVVGHFMERAVRFFPAAHDTFEGNAVGELFLRPGLGVYLFFAISGFVIARQALKARAAPLSPTFLKAYFGRRILRIEPPYVILLVGTFLLVSVTGYRPEQTHHFEAVPASLGVSLIGSIVYLHDLVWGTYPRLFPPGWSLEIEVQFYCLAPILFWAWLRARSRVAKLGLGAFGLAGGALVSLIAPHRIGPAHTDMSILLFFHFFWLGILLAHLQGWIVERVRHLSPVPAGLVGWGGFAIYLVMPNAPADDLVVALAIRAATLAAVAAMFVSAFAPASSFRRFCVRPWISLIGGACYSIYLTHLQVIQALTGGLAKLGSHVPVGLVGIYLGIEVTAVVAIGMAFYVAVERPFMTKDWPQRVRSYVKSWLRPAAHTLPGR